MARITQAEFEATEAKVAQINNRAQARGFTGLIDLHWNPVVIETIDDFGFTRTEHWIDATLVGKPPCYGGWIFLATLDWDSHAGLVVRTAPGAKGMVDRSTLTGNFCAHCNTNRRRNQTYLVRHEETGRELQVGSTCIKDFLGWSGSIVFLDEESINAGLPWGLGSGLPDSVGTEYAMAVAWALIKLDGYKPASSYGPTTKGDVLDVLWPPRQISLERRQDLARIAVLAEEAKVRAAECIAWVLSDDFTGTSDYALNLKAIAGAESVSARNIGVLASAPQAWAKAQERTLVKQNPTSNWIGEVKQRLVFTATIYAIRFIEGEFGTTVLYSLRDGDGNIIKWFASREALGDKIGETFTLKATIKELDAFQDIKQTVITRAKVQVPA